MDSYSNQVVRTLTHHFGAEIAIVLGDITTELVDAIVNAANSQLSHGGGVAGAISRRGGPTIQQESDLKAPVSVGQACFTSAGDLPAKFVIHAVGPRWGEGDEDAKLSSAVRSALDIASSDELRVSTISMPAISTGIFGFPLERAVRTILGTLKIWLDENPVNSVKQIRLCLFDQATVDEFDAHFSTILGED
jgi:O-acetyl-ADP-ribose deacetylase